MFELSYEQAVFRLAGQAYTEITARLENARYERKPGRLGEITSLLYERADEHLAAHPPERCACAKGCAWCCHLSVALSVPELYTVWHAIAHTNDQALLDAVKARATLDDYGRCASKMPCVLLGEDKTCGIYQNRPLTCRAMFVRDDGGCGYHFGNPNVFMPYLERPRIGIQSLEMAVDAASAKLASPWIVDLDKGLLALLTVPEPDAVFKYWLEGDATVLAKARVAKGLTKPMLAAAMDRVLSCV